jgi:hypothetical protein
MIPRVPLIAALLLIEIAIVGGAVIAVRGVPSSWSQSHDARAATTGDSLTHETFEAGAHPAVTVNIGYADVTFVTRRESTIDVSVSASSMHGLLGRSAPISAHQAGDTLTISTPLGESWSPMGDDRMVTVLLPAEARVTVINGGDISATGLRAEASFSSNGNGHVTIQDFAAPSLRVASSNGRVTLHNVNAPQLNISSSNGRVEATALQVRNGSVDSSNGRVTLGFAPGSDTVISADTSNGHVRVSGFAPATATATVHRSSDDDDEDDDSSQSQSVRIGAGNGRLDVHASNGSINLSQEG